MGRRRGGLPGFGGERYGSYRPERVCIPAADYQARAAALLRSLGETPEGQIVVFVVSWARRQLEAERAAAPPPPPS